MDRDQAVQWVSRWDAQQQWFMPDREQRFTVLIDAVEAGAGRDDPLVLDLGCGPGSLAVRLLDRMPAARVVAIDTDPLLLALGRAAYGDRPGLRFADQDLRVPGWASRLGLGRAADVAVSTTALHWLNGAELRAMYAELATVLRPVQPVQRGGAHGRVRRPAEVQPAGPARIAQVLVGETEPGPVAVRGAAQRQQQRIGVDGHHARRGHPVEQPDRE